MSVVVVDGKNSFMRAYHANKDLTRSDGVPIGGIYGYYRILRSVVAGNLDRHVIVCWEGGCARRKRIHPGYKSNREHADRRSSEDFAAEVEFLRAALAQDPDNAEVKEALDDLVDLKNVVEQLRVVYDLTSDLGICALRVPGVEADDLIAQVARANDDVLVVSTDRDFYQLLHRPGVKLDRGSHSDQYVTSENFAVRLKDRDKSTYVACDHPLRYRLAHCLLGDSGDEVPGIPGIGEKTAYGFVSELPLDALAPIDWDVVEFAARRSKSARTKRIADHMDEIVRNWELVDLLEVELLDAEQVATARRQLDRCPAYEMESVLTTFRLHEFKSVLEDPLDHLWPFERTSRETQMVKL